ncbi:hypothetical protein Q7P37_006874 [Cladosporium fusiforme]
MDIIVQNVPSTVTQKQLKACFAASLRSCGIIDYHCHLPRGKNFAFITVLDPAAGQRFLSFYGVPQNTPRHQQSREAIMCNGQRLRCQKSRNEPSEFDIGALRLEASKRMAQQVTTVTQDSKRTRRFNISNIRCGMWDFDDDSQRLVFQSQFTLQRAGTITFGLREAIVLLGNFGEDQVRMDVNYFACENVTLADYHIPTITFTLQHNPKFYQVKGDDVLEAGLRGLTLGPTAGRQTPITKVRVLGLNDAHQRITGPCRVYQVRLVEAGALSKVKSLLHSSPKMPSTYSLATDIRYPKDTLERAILKLENLLTETRKYGNMPFPVRFQLDRLVRNGCLPPSKVTALLPTAHSIWKQRGPDPISNALAKLARHLPVPGPDTYNDYTIASLEASLHEFAESYDYHAHNNPYELVKRHQHINLVHRTVITPTALYLEGPEPEPTNRVLRRYADSTDFFMRVVFTDEDGGPVRYDPRASQRFVYDERFRNVLLQSIIIAGRGFDFLGFSHSALRAHSCWFMAPIFVHGTLNFASHILKALGNFDQIRTPAKCAARIGQNFTDTNDTVDLNPSSVRELAIITRNGYDFSDGVGTISREILAKVWRVYGTKRLLKPTALQIRFQGSKGMVSLDSRLIGERLLLRSNMKKFETSSSWKLEVCGAAFKPLPMFLNRQLIKILEDLEVPTQAFLDLQIAAMSRLRFMTESSINTALFLRESASQSTQISALIDRLGQVGLDYHHDQFLYSVVEMAVVTELRDLKYRGRIPVKDGMTLYGIMDETGYLQEGEVFVITERRAVSAASSRIDSADSSVPGGKQILVQNNVVITRSPAMHPGDVQLVHAVDVPADSPLHQLRNVVVFSQHGTRDLPSQLSGGDLDGDLYNVVFDRSLQPVNTYVAAEYPRATPLELDRAVTAKDMSDFFVTFMETDQLGMLCNVHLQLADQRSLGVLDPDCVKISQMASVAVDYSKTGIPIQMKELPRYDRYRPDFMAPSPRVLVSTSGELDFEDLDEHDDDAFEGIDEEKKPMRYYRSEKVLGQLYRNIDEKQFVVEMQRQHHARILDSSSGLLDNLCDYVLRQDSDFGVLYESYMDLARDIRAGYEDSLLDILHTYSPTIHSPLSETEAFAGTILGRQGGAQGKPLRELSKAMRERFDAVAEYANMRIINGDAAMNQAEYLDALYDLNEREIEAWPRAIACLVVACREKGAIHYGLGELKSFKYIAAATCLRELERTRRAFGSYGPLPKWNA